MKYTIFRSRVRDIIDEYLEAAKQPLTNPREDIEDSIDQLLIDVENSLKPVSKE